MTALESNLVVRTTLPNASRQDQLSKWFTRMKALFAWTCAAVLLCGGWVLFGQDTGGGTVSEYRVGPRDEMVVHVADVEEYATGLATSVDASGFLDLPRVGRLQAAGKSVSEIETDLTTAFSSLLVKPEVSIRITAYHSQPVSILGSVVTPGVHQVEEGKRLYEVLSLAGGLRSDAGPIIKITRRKEYGPLPIAGAHDDETGTFLIGEVQVKSITRALHPDENILVKPFDVISVPSAEMVFVVGAVRKQGSFPVADRESLSVLQAIALAEGLEQNSVPKRARILRRATSESERVEIPVNIKAIIAGKTSDVWLAANDILFIPTASGVRGVMGRTAEIVAQATAMGLAYH